MPSTLTPLLPERHTSRDFFVLDTIDVMPRSDMATMEHPIFSLSTRADRRRLSYQHNDVRVEIIPSSLGLPTVFDKDIVIYCISKLVAMRNRGEAVGPCVRLTTHDMLVETNRPTNNLGYERLVPALNRLRGVVINTTVQTGGQRTTRGFGLIEEFEYNRKGSMFAERLRYLEIRLSDWLFRAVLASEVLPISRDYFRLRRPIDRRIYEIARKHCGRQASWRVGTELLQKKCGSKQAGKHFSSHMRALVRSNHLPDFTVTLDEDQAVFLRREKAGAKEVSTSKRFADRAPASPAPKPAPQSEAGSSRPSILIGAEAMEALRDIAPGWDRYWLENCYVGWAADKEPARDENARFLAWARNFTKGKKP